MTSLTAPHFTTTNTTPQSGRDLSIDALRGLALFGIFAVNIQSFTWGLSGFSLGILNSLSTSTDTATVFFTALLLEYKCYPLFCFCFGYGFTAQTQHWLSQKSKDNNKANETARKRFTKRLNVMLLLGALHGTFLYFGDILSRYAMTGYILRRHVGAGPRGLLGAIKFWFWATLVLTIVTTLLAVIANRAGDGVSATAAHEIYKIHDIYTTSNYLNITAQRFQDYLQINAGFIFYMPQIMLLFLLGAFTARMGWLKASLSQRKAHRAIWKKVLITALLIGLPINVVYAFSSVELAKTPSMAPSFAQILTAGFIPVLSFAYIACAALAATSIAGQRVLRVFAAAGKLALTNYLTQSIVMGTLLYGYGFAWGKNLAQFQLFILVVIIYALQLLFSHIYLRYFSVGPMEILWRKLS